MYWRLSSCSARSARALSKGRPSARPTSRMAFCRVSLSNSLVPAKFTSAMVGRSSTTTTSTLPLASRRMSLNSPSANSERIAAAPLSSSYWSPTRSGMEAKTVPGSTRCRPSMRMSCTRKGSSAQAALAAKTMAARVDAARTPRRLIRLVMNGFAAAAACRKRLKS